MTVGRKALLVIKPYCKIPAMTGAFYFFNQPNKPAISLRYLALQTTK